MSRVIMTSVFCNQLADRYEALWCHSRALGHRLSDGATALASSRGEYAVPLRKRRSVAAARGASGDGAGAARMPQR
jgi:hypothetical protein